MTSDPNARQKLLFGIIKQLSRLGREQGYLTFDNINDVLPEDVESEQEIDDVLSILQALNIEIIEHKEVEHVVFEKPNDIVRNATKLIVPDIADEILHHIIRSPARLYELPSRKFEELIAGIFHKNGYKVTLTPETRDGGFDILAIRNDALGGDHLHLIECKRYAAHRKIDVGIVRSLLGVVHSNDAHKGHLVTTSFFTPDAMAFTNHNRSQLLLSDYHKVVNWLRSLDLNVRYKPPVQDPKSTS